MANKQNTAAPTEQASPALDQISRRLVTARLNAEPLTEYPGELPDTLKKAYAVQTASIARWPDTVAGWKVGMVPESYRQGLRADRLAGPIFQSSVCEVEHGSTRSMPIFAGGFAAIEAEFVLKLARTVTPER